MEKCNYNISKPKKKKRCFVERESPFPVPIASIAGVPSSNDKWCYYTGQLIDNYVKVVHSGDMELLNKMGFFGELSIWGRHGQQASAWKRRKGQRGRSGEARRLDIISRRKYLRRLRWKAQAEGNEEDEDNHGALPTEMLPLRLGIGNLEHAENTGHVQDILTVPDPVDKEAHRSGNSDVYMDDTDRTRALTFETQNISSEPIERTKTIVDDWGSPMADNDPWATTTEEEAADFWGSSEPIDTNKEASSVASQSQTFKSDTSVNSKIDEDTHRNEVSQSVGVHITVDSETEDSNVTPSQKEPINSSPERTILADHSVTNNECSMATEPDDSKEEISSRPKAVDPRCESDHEDGSMLVVNDTDESDGEAGDRLLWEPAVKRNPLIVKETLHLTFEEAYFLSYGLGCLVVLDEQKNPMKLTAMWKEFSKRQPNFLQNYIVYHNFRSKGWVPKPGIKFGGDFVVYKEGPPFYHSTYVVLVRLIDADSFDAINDGQHPTPTWHALAGQNRITEQAAKELMICYVLKPPHLSPEDLMSPKCISHFKIQEVVVKRWLSKHERENLQYMEIP